MAPEIKISSTFHIKLSDLNSAEKATLKKANTIKKGCWESVGAEATACSISNRDILDESELRAFLKKYPKNEKARSVLLAKVPSLVKELDYNFPVVTERKFNEVKINLAKYFDKKIELLTSRVGSPTMKFDLMVMPDQFSQDWFSYFKNDAWLAYGIFQKAYASLDPALKNQKEVPVSAVKAFLQGMRDQVKNVEAKGFITVRVFDPLKDSDADGTVEFAATSVETKTRNDSIKQYFLLLAASLNRLAADYRDKGGKTQETYDFYLGLIEQSEDLLGNQVPDAKLLTSTALGLAIQYYETNFLDVSKVQELIIKLNSIAEQGGYFVTLETEDDMGIPGLFLGAVPIEQTQILAMNIENESEVHQEASFYLLPKPYARLYEYQFGATTIPQNISYFIGSQAIRKVREIEHEATNGSWETKLWKEITSSMSEEEKRALIVESVKYHEMVHNWMSRKGDLSNPEAIQENGLKFYEGPALYGNISHASQPIATLMFILLDRTLADVKDPKQRIFDPQEPLMSVAQDLFYALAVGYGVEIPKDLKSRNNTAWIQQLFEKIEASADTLEARQAILRTQVALAYQRRYGSPLVPFKQSVPTKVVSFEGPETDFLMYPWSDLSESEQDDLRIQVADNLDQLATQLEPVKKDIRHLSEIDANQYYYGVVGTVGGYAEPIPFTKPFTIPQIKELGGYAKARYAHALLRKTLEKIDLSAFRSADLAGKIDLFVGCLRTMAEEIRLPAAQRKWAGIANQWGSAWEVYQQTQEYTNFKKIAQGLSWLFPSWEAIGYL